MNKAVLRKLYLQKRRELKNIEIDNLTDSILANFSTLNFKGLSLIHFFYPILEKHEFNTLVLKDWLNRYHPEIGLVLSRSNLREHTLQHIKWTDGTLLEQNSWGIVEPVDGERVSPAQLDMILVPLLAFDKAGNRLGYGKGFYDRFLKECRTDTLKAGISFFEPIDGIIDTSPFDIPLDLCITPDKIWDFSETS